MADMILLIDNYDSFVYNLARYFAELGVETRVIRNDAVTIAEIRDLSPQAIVLSPGPCTPTEAGICIDVVRQIGPSIPLLGVCLGHQAIAAALGGQIIRAPESVHGRTSLVRHVGTGIFADLPDPLTACRYHSLIVCESTLPRELEIIARTDDGIPMALRHRDWPIFGVQFHPESILTVGGHDLLKNFLTLANIPITQLPTSERGELRAEIDWQASVQTAGRPLNW